MGDWMPIFTISYELRNKSHDYRPFAQELKKQKCFPIQGNMCLASFANNATEVHNYLRRLMDKNDSLMVAELHQHFCYTGAAKNVAKWLELNPPAALPKMKADETLAAGVKRAQKTAAANPVSAEPAPELVKEAAAKPAKASTKAAAKPAEKKSK